MRIMALSLKLRETLVERLRQRRRELAGALTSRLHEDGFDSHAEASLPRRADETDDDAAAETQRANDVTHLARTAAELARIDAALARVAAGEFGDCEDCGEPIAPARLDVNPAAARCAECQSYAEQVAAHARLVGV
jgi:DnaK suppressor protein